MLANLVVLFFGMILAVLVYRPCVKGGYIFDDTGVLFALPQEMRRGWRRLLHTSGRFVTLLSYAVNIRLCGKPDVDILKDPAVPRQMHMTNLVIHFGVSCGVGLLSSVLGFSVIQSVLAGLLMLFSPLAAQAACYISGRAVLLGAILGITGIVLFLTGHPFLAVPMFLAAAASKEDHLVLFVTTGALAWIGHQPAWPWLMIPLGLAAWKWRYIRDLLTRPSDIHVQMVAGFEGSLPQPNYTITSLTENILGFTAWIFGFKQSSDHYPPRCSSVSRSAAALALIVVGVWLLPVLPRSQQAALVLIALSPVVPRFFIRGSDTCITETRLYFAAIGASLLLAALPWPAVVLLFPWFAWRCRRIAVQFSDRLKFWTAVAATDPAPRPFLNLGRTYESRGNFPMAEYYYNEALRVRPGLGPALVDLAAVQARTGRMEEAHQTLLKCAHERPRYSYVWKVLGDWYARQNDKTTAAACYAKVLELKPGFLDGKQVGDVILI